MVEYTNIQDNSEEIMKCIVIAITSSQENMDKNLLNSLPN